MWSERPQKEPHGHQECQHRHTQEPNADAAFISTRSPVHAAELLDYGEKPGEQESVNDKSG